MKNRTSGFTIVELLIVIVVIGILAAISLVAFGAVQSKASVSVVKSELNSLGKQLRIYHVNNGSYPTTTTQLESLGWKASIGNYQQNSGGNVLYCTISS